MREGGTIQVFEYSWLQVGKLYGIQQVEFRQQHFNLLNQYATQNPDCGYFLVYYNRIRFQNYVGVIKIDDLTIEILPKTDRHTENASVWQNVLIEMLAISLQVEAETTTNANIDTRQMGVLETYMRLFLKQTEMLMRQGLVKKYRTTIGNNTALKGKLLVHQQIAKNAVHAERFYIQYQTYDRDNLFNAILYEALNCIRSLNISLTSSQWCNRILLDFPECRKLHISERLFDKLAYDRKTTRYETAIELARIILLNYHPDIKGGNNNILAIMFDMNLLWESYVKALLLRAKSKVSFQCSILPQRSKYFWRHPFGRTLSLRPDFIVEYKANNFVKRIVLDTKWKFRRDTTIEDVRQLYAYGNYFAANQRCLIYPEKLENDKVIRKEGRFYNIETEQFTNDQVCDLMFIDLLDKNNNLDKNIGEDLLSKCFLD